MRLSPTLSAIDRQVLDFEREWWLRAEGRPKHEAIRERLEMSTTRYYALLDRLADSPAAASYDPLVVHRIRRRKFERRRSRLVGSTPYEGRPR